MNSLKRRIMEDKSYNFTCLNSNDKVPSLLKKLMVRRSNITSVHSYDAHYGHTPYASGGGTVRVGGFGNGNYDDTKICIFFYQFSNPFTTPKFFTSTFDFSTWCISNHIPFPPYVRDIIDKLGTVRIACKKGCTDLVIRQNWVDLKVAIESGDSY